jgi:hypothetical protein
MNNGGFYFPSVRLVSRMNVSSNPTFSNSHLNYFENVILALLQINDNRASGRLSIRNIDRFGLAHLYFKQSRLVHVAGDKRYAEDVLQDLLTWSKGQVRFDTAVVIEYETLTWQQAGLFVRWLSVLEMHCVAHGVTHQQMATLTHQLARQLPQKPIALPERIANYEEYEFVAPEQQLQRFSEGVSQFVEHVLPAEQREQIAHLSEAAVMRAEQLALRARHVAHRVRTRLEKNLHGGGTEL